MGVSTLRFFTALWCGSPMGDDHPAQRMETHKQKKPREGIAGFFDFVTRAYSAGVDASLARFLIGAQIRLFVR